MGHRVNEPKPNDWKIDYLQCLYGRIKGTRRLLHLAKETDFESDAAQQFKAGWICGYAEADRKHCYRPPV